MMSLESYAMSAFPGHSGLPSISTQLKHFESLASTLSMSAVQAQGLDGDVERGAGIDSKFADAAQKELLLRVPI